jgi:hypothetical protein
MGAGMSRTVWSRILIGTGVLSLIAGALDPMEGSLIILPGTAVTALGALLAHSRQRLRLYVAFAMVAVGVGALFALSAYGGFGGQSARPMWWGLLILPYPLGWLLALFGGILALVQSFQHRGPATPVA